MSSETPGIDPARADRFGSRVGDYTMLLPEPASMGEGLRALQEARGVAEAELAQRLGTDERAIRSIEHAAGHEFATMIAYLDALGSTEVELRCAFADGAKLTLPLPSSSS
jgi:hypothetical protein